MPDEVQQGAKRQGDKISRKFVWHECKSITVHERTCRYNTSIILETCLRIQPPHIAPDRLGCSRKLSLRIRIISEIPYWWWKSESGIRTENEKMLSVIVYAEITVETQKIIKSSIYTSKRNEEHPRIFQMVIFHSRGTCGLDTRTVLATRPITLFVRKRYAYG